MKLKIRFKNSDLIVAIGMAAVVVDLARCA